MWNPKKTLAIGTKIKYSGRVMLASMTLLLLSNSATANDSNHESINVHGDWVVTVSNSDGSIAQERSFQNALVTPGLLVGMLTRGIDPAIIPDGIALIEDYFDGSPGPGWKIHVTASGVNATAECTDLLGEDFAGGGFASESQRHAVVSAVTVSSFTLTRNLTLPIDCVSGASYTIATVKTAFDGSIYNSGAKNPVNGAPFTEKTLATPITGILPDQVVTLKATISFQ